MNLYRLTKKAPTYFPMYLSESVLDKLKPNSNNFEFEQGKLISRRLELLG